MEKVFQTIKNLYKGSEPVKTHLLYILLMVLPILASVVISYVDKDTPKSISLILIGVGLVLFLLSIIPCVVLSGFRLMFLNNRYNGINEGIPKVSFEMLKRGIIAIPFDFVWCVYMGILAVVIVGSSFIPMFYGIFNKSVQSNVPLVIFLILLTIILYILGIIICCIISAFFAYVSIEYAKDFKYKNRMFNPLLLFEAMRKTFKSTFITAVKYLVLSIIAQTIFSIVGIIIFLVVIVSAAFIFAMILPENALVEYNPGYMLIVFILSTAFGLAGSYLTSIFWLGYSDSVVDIYKSEIESTLPNNEV